MLEHAHDFWVTYRGLTDTGSLLLEKQRKKTTRIELYKTSNNWLRKRIDKLQFALRDYSSSSNGSIMDQKTKTFLSKIARNFYRLGFAIS